jgi:hypothetical protein
MKAKVEGIRALVVKLAMHVDRAHAAHGTDAEAYGLPHTARSSCSRPS